jgi:nitrogen-specific signal transduction histidine kinase
MSEFVNPLLTRFAPAPRAGETELAAQIAHFGEMVGIQQFLNALTDIAVVINEYRQVVFGNQAFRHFIGSDGDDFLGKRMGEIIGCEHATREMGGCGTSEFCSVCGAVDCFLATLNSKIAQSRDCMITTMNLDAFEFEVHGSPYETELGNFVFMTLKDVGEAKRREMLERVFFHDILNTAGGMRGVAELLVDGDCSVEFGEIALHLADQLIDEIYGQMTLNSAEHGQLEIQKSDVSSRELLTSVSDIFNNHEIVRGKNLHVIYEDESFDIVTDATILKRILVNMTKNACEASQPGWSVTVAARRIDGKVVFSVHNEGVMDSQTQLQIFKRSFSTKGPGRGLGTYSMRLLGEKYLGGKVRFQSNSDRGTVFWLELEKARCSEQRAC